MPLSLPHSCWPLSVYMCVCVRLLRESWQHKTVCQHKHIMTLQKTALTDSKPRQRVPARCLLPSCALLYSALLLSPLQRWCTKNYETIFVSCRVQMAENREQSLLLREKRAESRKSRGRSLAKKAVTRKQQD